MASYTAQQAEALLKPQFEKYGKLVDDEVWAEVEGYYHPNGVLVHKDKEAVYGSKAITAHLAKFAEGTGKSVATILNAKYEGAGDYLIITADFSAETEKAGTVKGKFLQIWKKEGDRHLVFHDEFEINP
ncbi:DUF4440 domain-containing protein [Caenorhabditis elegans]|uniref:DUF4440 domain-containing protein n=1 Tax=Caenorhabditis elegans TaxID=6239 RepID=Q4R148_CAEEL|nr:DUF4440 domain-containing protein [Caenorhabditis elegans]CCD63255.1 DUF4440 domain-containing protein [Caenorhabditis elegans]|eukprot:NP_001033499.1 Uncharacterized protein CELE_R09E12.9 [Caenorhabditis elegans]